MNTKGQGEVISLILIAGIVIGLVGTAYLWGAPLIEKRSTVIDVDLAKDFLYRLDSEIIEIANRGSGETTIDIPKGLLAVVPGDAADKDNNSVILEIIVGQQMLFPGTIVYLGDTRDEVGIYGEADPSILTMKGESFNQDNRILLKSHYRELDTVQASPLRGFRIVVNEGMGTVKGNSKVTVSFERTETITSGAANFGDLVVTHVSVIPF